MVQQIVQKVPENGPVVISIGTLLISQILVTCMLPLILWKLLVTTLHPLLKLKVTKRSPTDTMVKGMTKKTLLSVIKVLSSKI